MTFLEIIGGLLVAYVVIILVINFADRPVGNAGFWKEKSKIKEDEQLYTESLLFRLLHPSWLVDVKHCGKSMRYVVEKGKSPVQYVVHLFCEECTAELLRF